MFAVQDEITQAITAALMPKLAAERPATLIKPAMGSIDAYELCLRARYYHQRRTPDGSGMALRLFEQAAPRPWVSCVGPVPGRAGWPRRGRRWNDSSR